MTEPTMSQSNSDDAKGFQTVAENGGTAFVGENHFHSEPPQASMFDFLRYLNSICENYAQWWAYRALTETIEAKQTEFSFEQWIHTEKKRSEDQKPQMLPFPLFEGIRKYIGSEYHVLLVGSPGVGKSTALLRCLVDFAQQEKLKAEPHIPVLVSLKKYQSVQPTPEDPSGMLALIRDALELEMPELSLEIAQVKKLLFTDQRLILLWDGLNEMPATSVRTELIAFREKCIRCKIPLICSSRELGSEGLGIKRRLIIQPLDAKEIDRFLQECMPNQKQKVRQLLDRDNRELSRTPFVLWMLYDTFQNTGNVADSLGEAFRGFFRSSYRGFKEDVPVAEARREAWNNWMQHLAFTMLSSPEPTDPGLVISKGDAEEVLAAKFGVVGESSSRVEELLKYHLLEKVSDKQVSFHHQLIQEYYVAEQLREHLPELKDEEVLKRKYLNYVKWTESVAMMLGLVDEPEDALRVVRSGLEVDLMLGARLAGEVKGEFQERAIADTMQKFSRDYPEDLSWLKLAILELMGKSAVSRLIPLLDDPDDSIRYHAHSTMLSIAPEEIPEQTRFREDSDWYSQILEESRERIEQEKPPLDPDYVVNLIPDVQFIYEAWASKRIDSSEVITKLAPMFYEPDSKVRWSACVVLGCLKSEESLPYLLRAVEDLDSSVRHHAGILIGQIGYKAAIPKLIDIVNNHSNSGVRHSAVIALGIIGTEEVIPGLCQAMQDVNDDVVRQAIESSQKVGSEAIALSLLKVMADHTDFFIRYLAAMRLGSLSSREDIAKLLCENYLQELVQQLEDPYIHTRWTIAVTLWNIASGEVIPFLRPKLTHLDHDIALSAALVLGRFGCNDAAPGLLEMMDYSNLKNHPDVGNISYLASYALGQIEGDVTSKYLPELLTLVSTSSGKDVVHAIATIQSKCKYYNHEIYQTSLASDALPDSTIDPAVKPTGTPIYNIEKVGILNTGPVTTKTQIGEQHPPPNLKE